MKYQMNCLIVHGKKGGFDLNQFDGDQEKNKRAMRASAHQSALKFWPSFIKSVSVQIKIMIPY